MNRLGWLMVFMREVEDKGEILGRMWERDSMNKEWRDCLDGSWIEISVWVWGG